MRFGNISELWQHKITGSTVCLCPSMEAEKGQKYNPHLHISPNESDKNVNNTTDFKSVKYLHLNDRLPAIMWF